MASTFTREDVQRLATLARLELSQEELSLFAGQLSDILAFAADVQSVDTAAIDVDDARIGPAPLREDEVEPCLRREDVLSQAASADHAAALFTVPRVFQE